MAPGCDWGAGSARDGRSGTPVSFELVTWDGEQCAKRASVYQLRVCLGHRLGLQIHHGPEHFTHEGAGCPQGLDHVSTECTRILPLKTGKGHRTPSPICAPGRSRMDLESVGRPRAPRTGRCCPPHRCSGRPQKPQ